MLDRLVASSPYVGLFVALLLSGLGLPIPEELSIVTAGVLAHRHVIHWWLALPVLIVGVVTGDLILYWAGRRWGARFPEHPLIRRLVDPARIEHLEQSYRKHGVLIVFAARHVAGLRGAAFVTAGIVGLPFWKFILADGIAIAYGVPLNFGLAYLFAEHIRGVLEEAHRVERWIALLALLGATVWILYTLRTRSRQRLGLPPASPGRPRGTGAS